MDQKRFQKALRTAGSDITEYLSTVSSRPVQAQVAPGYLKPLLPSQAPRIGEAWSRIRSDLFSIIMPGMTHWNSSRFLAFFPAPVSYPSILGEVYSAMLTCSAFNWSCAPAVTELETIVMDWLVQMLNLPKSFSSASSGGSGGGVIQGTTSEAIVAVMVAARERYLKRAIFEAKWEGMRREDMSERQLEDIMADRRKNLVALGSEACHSSTQKAARITGVRYRSVPVSHSDGFSMRGTKLRETLEECLEAGLEPFYLTVTLGTTTTCAVDFFEEIAEVLKDWPEIWVHVDAAYAGNALVCEEYQHLTRHFGGFDSFSMALSKWLLTNIDACCLFIKNRKHLINAMSIDPSYLRNAATDSGAVIDYRNWQIPLSRRFRALKIWFVIRTYGVDGFKALIRKHISLGNDFAKSIASQPHMFEIVTPPAFALTVISVRSKSGSRAESNRLTKAVHGLIERQGEIMLTSSAIGEYFVIRIVGANPNTDAESLRRAFDILMLATEQVTRQHQQDTQIFEYTKDPIEYNVNGLLWSHRKSGSGAVKSGSAIVAHA